MKAALLGRRFDIRFSGVTDFIYAADTAAAFIACADQAPEGAHVFNVHGEAIDVASIVSRIDAHLPGPSRGLIAFGGPPIPMPPSLDDTALRALRRGAAKDERRDGIAETIRRFAELRDAGRLDTSDID